VLTQSSVVEASSCVMLAIFLPALVSSIAEYASVSFLV
jgi:hypothetical protein